jgi:hypothetical protein
MVVVDVATFVGEYPYRAISHGTVRWLLTHMDRVAIDRAWVGHLSSFLYKDPAPGNAVLVQRLAGHRDRLAVVPAIHPGLPRWEDDLSWALEVGAPALRPYPMHHGLDPSGGAMRVLAAAAAAAGIPLLLTVRFEDPRQRHPLDVVADLPPAAVRRLVRSDPDVRFLVTHADRAFIEEVHFGLAPQEAARVLWDISWIWGPPENHLATLLQNVGVERFTLGTGMPLRIPDSSFAKLDLLDLTPAGRAAILGGNLDAFLG